jgi:hypothetical protein
MVTGICKKKNYYDPVLKLLLLPLPILGNFVCLFRSGSLFRNEPPLIPLAVFTVFVVFEELFKMFDSSDSLDEQMTQGIFLGFSKEEVKECLKVWEDITNVKYKTI